MLYEANTPRNFHRRLAVHLTFLRKSLRFGRLALPVWTVGLAAAGILAVAGQAVGPVLVGAVRGDAGLTVQQAIVATEDSYAYADLGNRDALITINDEGTSFMAALEIWVGGKENLISLNLSNVSDAPAKAVLTLKVPPQLQIEVEEEIGTDVLEAQLSSNTWLLDLTADSEDENLDIAIVAKADAQPGFYTITGIITQVTG